MFEQQTWAKNYNVLHRLGVVLVVAVAHHCIGYDTIVCT